MYRPAHFREDDPDTLAAFIDAYPLATVVAAPPAGLIANHLPLLRIRTPAGETVLRGHIARANDLWKLVPAQSPILAIFTGVDRYVSPSWYPTKVTTGEVVPTWNYSVVHAHGTIRFIDDGQWLRSLVEALTDRNEAGRAAPWSVSDAPDNYIARMLRAIVGFEIPVERLEGKFKASQNRTEGERRGVASGREADGIPESTRDELVRPPK